MPPPCLSKKVLHEPRKCMISAQNNILNVSANIHNLKSQVFEKIIKNGSKTYCTLCTQCLRHSVLTEDEAVVPEPEEVSLITVEREPLAHKAPVGVEGLGPNGRVVPLLGHQELCEQVILESDHGADVVAAQRVVQVEPDAVVLVEAEGGARLLRHGCGSGGGGMVRPPALAMWGEEEYPRCCFWVSRYSSRDLFAVHLHSLLLSSLHACTN